ncbi:MAG: type II toxin-antitoxin system VapC family toxin [bacterium]
MTGIIILDAHGLMAFLEKEQGYEKVKAAFVSAVKNNQNILMTAVNFGEVYYIILKECGIDKAIETEKIIESLPIDIINVNLNMAKEAAIYKANKKMSYADCFAAALTNMHNGILITGDPEFKEVEKEIKITWLK